MDLKQLEYIIKIAEEIESDYKRRQGNLVLKLAKVIKPELFARKAGKKYKSNDTRLKTRLTISRRKAGKALDKFMRSFGDESESLEREFKSRLREIEEEIAREREKKNQSAENNSHRRDGHADSPRVVRLEILNLLVRVQRQVVCPWRHPGQLRPFVLPINLTSVADICYLSCRDGNLVDQGFTVSVVQGDVVFLVGIQLETDVESSPVRFVVRPEKDLLSRWDLGVHVPFRNRVFPWIVLVVR